MAKETCIDCGKEIGFANQVQLADMTYICWDCLKKTIPYFEHLEMTSKRYREHLKQNEDGQKLYETYFHRNRSVVKLIGGCVLYDPATALICIMGKRGGFMGVGGTAIYNVMRVADLDVYEKASRFTKGLENRRIARDSFALIFHNVDGMYEFLIPADDASIRRAARQLNDVFGGKSFVGGLKQDVNDQFYVGREALMQKADAAIRAAHQTGADPA